jgi:hypothetical protein
MGRTALYRDPAPFRPARAEVQVDSDVLFVTMPDGRQHRHMLDGYAATLLDGVVAVRAARQLDVRAGVAGTQGAGGAGLARGIDARPERRFVRMLLLERDHERHLVITPPDRGAVAPSVVRLPEAPDEAAIIDDESWDALADWIMGGGRLAGCSISDLARLAAIATPQFAVLIGEVAAQCALELVSAARGPLRGVVDIESALHPLVSAARHSQRVAEALISALAHAAGATRRKRRA